MPKPNMNTSRGQQQVVFPPPEGASSLLGRIPLLKVMCVAQGASRTFTRRRVTKWSKGQRLILRGAFEEARVNAPVHCEEVLPLVPPSVTNLWRLIWHVTEARWASVPSVVLKNSWSAEFWLASNGTAQILSRVCSHGNWSFSRQWHCLLSAG